MNQKQSLEISIPSELGYEKVALSAIAVLAQKTGFSRERTDDMKTALAEAVTNAIEHGNQYDVEIKVLIVLTIQEKSLALNVVDQGYQPIPHIPLEREPKLNNRGWGMFLIQKLMDEVEVVAQPGRNEIKMVIHLEH